MADEKPLSKRAGSDNPSNKPGGKQKPLVCAEWEAMLVDALDGTLSAKDTAPFDAHLATCTACARLMEEARRGGEWLHFLETEPEIPSDLVARILANTSGASESMVAVPVTAGAPVAVAQPGWLPGLERHAMQSRWIMTAAMAFFSIAFTLNVTGVRISGFHLSDLAPSNLATNLKRQFYVADAGVSRYYNNLRFVYELESRVRQMKRDAAPAENRGTGNDGGQSGATPAPARSQGTQPEAKQPGAGGAGSAQKSGPEQPKPTAKPSEPPGEELQPVLAGFHTGKSVAPCGSSAAKAELKGISLQKVLGTQKALGTKEVTTKESCSSKMYVTKKDRAERSLA